MAPGVSSVSGDDDSTLTTGPGPDDRRQPFLITCMKVGVVPLKIKDKM